MNDLIVDVLKVVNDISKEFNIQTDLSFTVREGMKMIVLIGFEYPYYYSDILVTIGEGDFGELLEHLHKKVTDRPDVIKESLLIAKRKPLGKYEHVEVPEKW